MSASGSLWRDRESESERKMGAQSSKVENPGEAEAAMGSPTKTNGQVRTPKSSSKEKPVIEGWRTAPMRVLK